jgi:2',3'-cyclic-nucleotide 2'-phosphodiesterase (5'-nucleotidase family)
VSLAILHTNDFHGTLTPEKADFLRQLKGQRGAIYFDTGDCIKTGNLGIPLRNEPAWGLLAEAGCDAGVLGNRETHVLGSAFRAKIEGHVHPLLVSNLRCRDGSRPLPSNHIFEHSGVRVGVFGVMVPMVTEKMKTQAASAYLWDPPLAAAEEQVRELRAQVDCLIALTHIGYKNDLILAERCPGIDIILGGHSHTVLAHPERVGSTWICQGGSHGRYVGSYTWADGELTGELLPLG